MSGFYVAQILQELDKIVGGQPGDGLFNFSNGAHAKTLAGAEPGIKWFGCEAGNARRRNYCGDGGIQPEVFISATISCGETIRTPSTVFP